MDLPSSNSQEMNTNSSQNGKAAVDANDKKPPQPQPDSVEKCPRCDSGNTKFCYYNNYSLSQPRYFCKACRRYWTKGGTLRNVPVGGGCRKNKRSAKRALDSHHHHHRHLLVQSHLGENNNNNNNVMLSSASFDPNINQDSLSLADNSNYSSPLRYEDSGACDSLSLAFATLQRQSNLQPHHPRLGFEFDLQNSTMGPQHQQNRSSGTNDLGLLSNFSEPQATCFKYSQNLHNYGFENGGGGCAQTQNEHHTQSSLLLRNEYLSLSNIASAEGYNQMKQEMNGDVNGNRILWGLPWQVDSNNGGVGEVFSLEKNNNLVLGTGSNNYQYNNDGYEVEGGGRSESWNNTGLAAASCWPNLINTTALIM